MFCKYGHLGYFSANAAQAVSGDSLSLMPARR